MKTVFLPRTRGYVGAEWQLIGLAECLRFRWARAGPFVTSKPNRGQLVRSLANDPQLI